jgi:hypothetical protein
LRLERLEERYLLAGDVVYRVNAGGAAVAGTPGWTADTNAAPSPYRNSAAAPSGAFSTTSAINLTNASIPAGTPQSLFQSERWDQPGGAEMGWAFPVTPGQYEVRLYFSEIYSGAFAVGARTFGVQIEGQTLLANYDVFAEVGANAGVVKKFTVNSDATLNINLLHGVEDPAVKAIEILTAGAAAPAGARAITSSITTGAPAPSSNLASSSTAKAPSVNPTNAQIVQRPSIANLLLIKASNGSAAKSQSVAPPITRTRKVANAPAALDSVIGNPKILEEVLRASNFLRRLSSPGKKV